MKRKKFMENETTLNSLLLERLDASSKRIEEIDKKIWDTFGKEKYVLISDMSGFSKLTEKHGIIHFMSLIAKQQKLIIPIIEKNNGKIIKTEADNFIICFDSAEDIINTSFFIHESCIKYNNTCPSDFHIKTCHGLSYGKLLLFKKDIFGNIVNIASKLGEDAADPFETLITEKLYNKLPKTLKINFIEKNMKISGINIKYYYHKFA
jgi:class 3 adenylate cyclase